MREKVNEIKKERESKKYSLINIYLFHNIVSVI